MALPDWSRLLLHSHWLPLILFAGAFADAFIASSLLILGEVFFIAAGYAIAALREWWFLSVIWFGAFCGDTTSYLIGRCYGSDLAYQFTRRRPKWRLNYMRAQRLLKARGVITVFSARLAGPISKFMPFIAGTLRMPVFAFLSASTAGIIVGSAQFILVGWLLEKGVKSRYFFNDLFFAHPILMGGFLLSVAAMVIWIVIRWHRRRST